MKNYAGRDDNDPPRGGGGYVVSEGKAGEELYVHVPKMLISSH